jgi:hypothetical protein
VRAHTGWAAPVSWADPARRRPTLWAESWPNIVPSVSIFFLI